MLGGRDLFGLLMLSNDLLWRDHSTCRLLGIADVQ